MELINGITVGDVAVVLASIIAGASLIVQGLDKIAGITPTTKDDAMVRGMRRAVSYVSALADRLALNPPKDKARSK